MNTLAEWLPRAAKELTSLPADDLDQIVKAVSLFVGGGTWNVDSIRGRPGQYRLRVGHYRVLFVVDHARQAMIIQAIVSRLEVYRALC
jgi:mRNA-degrading endonuclease RelE of RelBE toxin-antitoxin system